jgi:hypothetical protein
MQLVAAEQNHYESILILQRDINRVKGLEKRPEYVSAERRFQVLAKNTKDPNVMTLQGERLVLRGKPKEALAVLEGALVTSQEDFWYRSTCKILIAASLKELGRPEDARIMLEVLHKAYVPEASFELGVMLRYSEPDYAHECFGRVLEQTMSYDSLPYMAELEMNMSMAAEAKEAQEDHTRKSMEWSRLANNTSTY